MEGRATRRELLRHALADGAGATVVASLLVPASAVGATETDARLIHGLLRFELLLAFVYQRVLASGLLSLSAEPVARALLAHEQAHGAVLATELTRLGGTPPQDPASVAAADRALAAHNVGGRLVGLRSSRGALRLLVEAEGAAERVYYKAMSKLGDPALLETGAEIMACEAQHATVLSELLHPGDLGRAVPDAMVQGTH
jgi:ferritin-like protein